MIDFKFENLFGITYNSGNILFSKTNNEILFSPVGNKVSMYDIKNGTSETIDVEARSNVQHIDISIKELLIIIDVDGYCILVNLLKKIVIGHFNFRNKVTSLKISPCGGFVCVGVKNGVQIYELPQVLTKQIEPLVLIKSYTALHSDSVKSICWSTDSRFILTAGYDTSLRLLNLFKIENYSPFSFIGHKKKVIMAVFSENNEKLFSISEDGVLFIWKYISEKSKEFKERANFNKKRSMMNLDSQEYVEETENPNEENLEEETREMSLYTEFEKKIYSGRYILEKKQVFTANSKISKAQINLLSNILVIALENGVFSIYDLNSFENLYTLQITDNKINSMSINNNGLWLAFGSRKNEQLLVWEWKSETYVLKNQGHNFDVTSLGISLDSSIIVSGGNDGRIKVWDTKSTTCMTTFQEHTAKVTDIKFPVNKTNMFISSSLDSTVRAFDLVKYVNFRTMTTPEPTKLNCVGIDSTGEIVVAGASDPYSIYVWNLKTGDIVDILSGHKGPISSLVFSLNKDLLLSSSWDKTVRTWSIYSKRGDYEVFEQNSEVLCVELNPDNKEFSATTIRGEIYTWDLENGVLKSKYYVLIK